MIESVIVPRWGFALGFRAMLNCVVRSMHEFDARSVKNVTPLLC